jgi:spore coat polysaccharide biosynthesis predicted glycosyltransferase SpsG
MSIAHTGKTLSEEHKTHIADSNRKKWADGVFDKVHVGENNVRWRGGVKYLMYPKEFYAIRRWIIERDNQTCQICGKDASRKGHIHHIDGNTKHNTEDNLILVCASCHIKIHSNFPAISSILAFRSKLEWNKL